MVIHHTGSLHVGIHHRGAYKFKASLFKILAYGIGKVACWQERLCNL